MFLRDHGEGLLQLLGGAELDDLGAGVEHRGVTGGDVVGVAGLECLLAGGGLERTLPARTYPRWGAWHWSSGRPLKNSERSASAVYFSKATV